MTQKEELLKTSYLRDSEQMVKKSRFGFFSLYPSSRAAMTDYAQKKAKRDPNGKPKTQPRGIYGGSKSAKVLNKTCFSEIKSPFVDCPYQDPGRASRIRQMQLKKKSETKETFKPARLQKTLMSSSYSYIECPIEAKEKKYRDETGKVISKSPNINANPLSKIVFKKQKEFKYMQSPFQNEKIQRKKQLDADLAKRGDPFRAGNPVKELFSKNSQVFNDTTNLNIKNQQEKTNKEGYRSTGECGIYSKKAHHESNFRPGGGHLNRYNGLFNKVEYLEEGEPKKRPATAGKLPSQTYKIGQKQYNSRPCPSVSLNKMNLMGKLR